MGAIGRIGRDAFTMNRRNWKIMDPELKKIAIWSYYKGAKRDPDPLDEGHTAREGPSMLPNAFDLAGRVVQGIGPALLLPASLALVTALFPEPGERARAIGVGRPDVLIRQGTYKWMPPLPAIPGIEMAGNVVQAGSGVRAVKVGDPVKRDEPLFEISTDKVDTEVPSPGEGVVAKILVQEGETVEVGTARAVAGSPAALPDAPTARRPPGPLRLWRGRPSLPSRSRHSRSRR